MTVQPSCNSQKIRHRPVVFVLPLFVLLLHRRNCQLNSFLSSAASAAISSRVLATRSLSKSKCSAPLLLLSRPLLSLHHNISRQAGRQAGRGADYDAAAMTFNGDGAQHWVGADYVRHHSYTAASFIHMTIEHGCGLWPKKNTFQLAPCRDPNTSAHCASPLSSSSYTSSFFSKSPGLRGSTWMCT